MIIDNFLLPRFLILELVFACHYLQFTRACTVLCGATKEMREDAGKGVEEAVGVDQQDATERRYKIVPKKGLVGLKRILLEDKSRKSKRIKNSESLKGLKGIKGLKKLLNSNTTDKNGIFDTQKVQSLKLPEDTRGLTGLKSILQDPSSCDVSLDDQHWDHPPLLYNSSGLHLLPLPSLDKSMVVRVKKGEVITVSCPGGRVNRTISNMARVQCVQEDMFLLNTTMVDIEQLGCSRNPREKEVLSSDSIGCGPEQSGKISSLGFQFERNLSPLVTVCHAKEEEVTYYTNHTLLGHLLNTRKVPDYRPNFKEGRVYFQGVSANGAYKQTRQKKLFSLMFGSESGSLFHPRKGLYLARGHLTPSGDLLYRNWQEVTYMYSNVVPQWQVVNNGNWREVEEAVRSRAKSRKSTLQVFTGTKGTLELRGKKLLLGKGSIPVPKYLWKLVVDTSSGDSIVFVTINNPHLKYLTRSVTLCNDVCEKAGWAPMLKDRGVIEQGYTQCCTTKEFKEKVPWLPGVRGGDVLIF